LAAFACVFRAIPPERVTFNTGLQRKLQGSDNHFAQRFMSDA
jgi:hypothetical protein